MKQSSLRKYFSTLLALVVTAFFVLGSAVAFAATPSVNVNGASLLFNNTIKIGQNAKVGFSTRYTGIATGVDAIVTVTNITNSTINNVDRVSTVNNWQIWNNQQIASGGGSSTYRIEFVATGTRDPIILENFSANVGDIDARQYVQFTGPSSITLSNNSALTVTETSGAYKFAESNGVGASDDDTRFWAQVKYTKVSAVEVTLGAAIGGSALFQLSFGEANWSGTAATPLTPPVVQYSVTYNLNPGGSTGGSGTTNGTSANSGVAQVIQAENFTDPTNYTFNSWNTIPDGSGVSYDPGDEIIPTSNVTLYAIWKPNSATFTYNGNGENSGSPPSTDTIQNGAQYTVKSSGTLQKTGFEFIGWNTLANGEGVFYFPGTLTNVVANTTVYAVWREIPVVPSDSPINIEGQPGSPSDGLEVDYVLDNQPVVTCDPNNPNTFWSMTVSEYNQPTSSFEIDAGCVPSDGEVYGTSVIPENLSEGVFEVVYENTLGEKTVHYFAVDKDGNFLAQSNNPLELAKTGYTANYFAYAISLMMIVFGSGIFIIARRNSK